MASWSNEKVLRFIELYRSIECLWKVKSKDYCNRRVRERGYEELARFCRVIDPEANKDFVLKKINNLRSAFRKELKKCRISRLPGRDPEEAYMPRLWYFHSLTFLKDQDAPLPEDASYWTTTTDATTTVSTTNGSTPVPRMGFSNVHAHGTGRHASLSVDGQSNASCASHQDSLLDMEVGLPFSPKAASECSFESEAMSEVEHKVDLDSLQAPILFPSYSDSPRAEDESQSPHPNQQSQNSGNINRSPPPSSPSSPSSHSHTAPLHKARTSSTSRQAIKRNLVDIGESSLPLSIKIAHPSNYTDNSYSGRPNYRPPYSHSNSSHFNTVYPSSRTRRASNPNLGPSNNLPNPNPCLNRNPNPAPPAGDWYEALGKNIGDKLRLLPWGQRVHAEKLILNVMYEAELGCLSRHTTLVSATTTTTPTTTAVDPIDTRFNPNSKIKDNDSMGEAKTSGHQDSNGSSSSSNYKNDNDINDRINNNYDNSSSKCNDSHGEQTDDCH